MSSAIENLYSKHIQPLLPDERLELLNRIAEDLPPDSTDVKTHSLEELRGLGKEIWEGVNALEYVEGLRSEWERPSC